MECSFQLRNKGALGISGSMMQLSRMLSTSGMNTKVYVPGKENKKRIGLAHFKSREFPDLEIDRQAKIEKLLVRGPMNVPKAAQDQAGLQQCNLYEDVTANLHGAGAVDVSDTDEDSDIFDDIFDSTDGNSSKNEQHNPEKCSLSDLVRQHKEAFLSIKREREAVTPADDSESRREMSLIRKEYKSGDLDAGTRRRMPYADDSKWKRRTSSSRKEYKSRDLDAGTMRGMPYADDLEWKRETSLTGKEYKSGHIDARTGRRTPYTAKGGGSYMEGDNKGMRPHQSDGGRNSAACNSKRMTQNESYKYRAGMGGKQDFGRVFGGDRPSRGRSNREGYSDAECKEGGKYFSAKVDGSDSRRRYKESKAQGGYADESRSGSKVERGRGFEGKRSYEGRARW